MNRKQLDLIHLRQQKAQYLLSTLNKGDKVRLWTHEWNMDGSKRLQDMIVGQPLTRDIVGYEKDGSYMYGGQPENATVQLGVRDEPGCYTTEISPARFDMFEYELEVLEKAVR